ncbi:hypothetical protein CBM2609_B120206 [Cupriavidus taiwanensis]|nr:hypothetical protein CBM2609_B120206 [Cupriavidus taiwanensis]SOZ47324.1 hypothetical protein CBM2610_B100206 [Cupriavidus taiwanensis]
MILYTPPQGRRSLGLTLIYSITR